MSAIDILLERETANDEHATIVTIHVPSGTPVEKNQVLFDIENSKATQEVEAPSSGTLMHDLQIGQTVAFGVPLARILPAAAEMAPATGDIDMLAASLPFTVLTDPAQLFADQDVPLPPPALSEVVAEPSPIRRYSREAARLMRAHGYSETPFHLDFITARDVRALTGVSAGADSPGQASPGETHLATSDKTPIASSHKGSRRKGAEIDALRTGAGSTLLSVLGVTLGAISVTRREGDFLSGRITDLVIYESARLMRKYRRMNAAYRDGCTLEHEAVHAGLAIDGGNGLIVYGIENADRLGLGELSTLMAEAVAGYFENTLRPAELTRATYTVTDLSEAELDFIFPLLPHGQSCIIGITRSERSGFGLFAGFDHRVTEGREVSMFLGELRDRILSFADQAANIRPWEGCAFCGQTLPEATSRGGSKGLLKILDVSGKEALCCASCWNGW